MTCIVGLIEDDKVHIGGDSVGSNGSLKMARKDEKVFQIEDMLFGFSGSYRAGQVIRYFFTKPKHDPKLTPVQYMHRMVIPEIRRLLGEHGSLYKKDEIEASVGTFLVGYKGHLFDIDSDYQIGEAVEPYNAIGSGSAVALGSLHASGVLMVDARDRVIMALTAAERYARGVGGPFVTGAV